MVQEPEPPSWADISALHDPPPDPPQTVLCCSPSVQTSVCGLGEMSSAKPQSSLQMSVVESSECRGRRGGRVCTVPVETEPSGWPTGASVGPCRVETPSSTGSLGRPVLSRVAAGCPGPDLGVAMWESWRCGPIQTEMCSECPAHSDCKDLT